MNEPEILDVKHSHEFRNGTWNIFETGALSVGDVIVITLHQLGHTEENTLKLTLEVVLVVTIVEGGKELARAHDKFEKVVQ